jgi:hypothetical protein
VFDAETISSGRVPADPMSALFDHRRQLDQLSLTEPAAELGRAMSEIRVGPLVPAPPMIVSVVANFPPTQRPEFPMIVGKASTAVAGPFDQVVLPDPACSRYVRRG